MLKKIGNYLKNELFNNIKLIQSREIFICDYYMIWQLWQIIVPSSASNDLHLLSFLNQ